MTQHQLRVRLNKLLIVLLPATAACDEIGFAVGETGSHGPQCGNNSPIEIDGKSTGFAVCDGVVNRPDQQQCPAEIRSGLSCSKGGDDECSRDDQCTEQSHGYCTPEFASEGDVCVCKYGCVSDSDCDENQICQCGSPSGTCVWAECKTNAQCEPNRLCAQSELKSDCEVSYEFTCQTQHDECRTNADCGVFESCALDYEQNKRVCSDYSDGACGRPFRVQGQMRVAGLSFVSRPSSSADAT